MRCVPDDHHPGAMKLRAPNPGACPRPGRSRQLADKCGQCGGWQGQRAHDGFVVLEGVQGRRKPFDGTYPPWQPRQQITVAGSAQEYNSIEASIEE